jgi:hypothetical protein
MAAANDLIEMRKLLDCPICMTLIVSGPIRQCKNGHHICDNCSSKLEKCPSCEEKIDGRNRQLENLRELVPLPCQNVDHGYYGCNVELKMKDLKLHQEECQHYEIFQWVILCVQEKVTFKDFISHFDTNYVELVARLKTLSNNLASRFSQKQ